MKRTASFFCALAVCFSLARMPPTAADETAPESQLTWMDAFAPISPKDSSNKLALVVITNDAPFAKPTDDKSRPVWCTRLVESVFRKAMETRDDLKDKIVLQSLAAGVPRLLSGNVDRNQPNRAIVALCDTNYRLLTMVVGVPDAQNMLTLIEDAQFAQTLLQQHGKETAEARGKLIQEITDYNSPRMTRIWRAALAAMTRAVAENAKEETVAADVAPSETLKTRIIARIGESFESIYLMDVKQRFALSEASDVRRLAVIEQHPQARQPWCDAMQPFIVGTDFQIVWRSVAELIWKFSPVVDDFEDEDFLRWWDQTIEGNTIVFALDPTILLSLQPWPPINVDNAADKRNIGWKALENAATKNQFRRISHQQLATLMRERSLSPIDVHSPSRARYVVFDPTRPLGTTIHEQDLPAKHIGRLNRSAK